MWMMLFDLLYVWEFLSEWIMFVGDFFVVDVDWVLSEGEFKLWIYMNVESDVVFLVVVKKVFGDGFK